MSLMIQWLRVLLSMQETWVQFLVWDDPTYHGETKPVGNNYRVCTPRAGALQQEATQMRKLGTIKRSPWSLH